MKALIIGGERHGEMVELLDGTKVWLDIERATQHRIRTVTNHITEAATGKVIQSFALYVAVHQDLLGPYEMQQVQVALNILSMNAFFREHGAEQAIPEEPAGSSLIAPGP